MSADGSSRESSRRDFLRVALGVAGALVVEVALPGCGPSMQSYGMAKRAEGGVGAASAFDFVPNAWIKIGTDNRVSFVLDRVEMGQGTMTSSAQLVAEELEIAPEKLEVELAGSDAAFNNTLFNVQLTGGSSSVASSYVPLRTAAATARELLRNAAAQKWGVSLAECKADDGEIVHVPSKRRVKYGDLAEAASKIKIDAPKLKDPKDWKWIGKPVIRKDAKIKVNGSAVYGIDVQLPDMRVATVVHPPALGSKLVSFDATEALKEPGVEAVFEIPQGIAVVAKSYWRVKRALQKLQIQWTDGDASLDSDLLAKQYRERVSRSAAAIHSSGNQDDAESNAAHVIDGVYEVPYLAHATMEPQNATAWIRGKKCDVWAPTQSPSLAAESVHRITGISFDDISVKQTLIGGGFGRRIQQDYVEEAVYIAMRIPHPVKVVWSREEDMRNDGYRPMVTTYMRGSIGKNGAISSMLYRTATQSIAAQSASFIAAFAPHASPIVAKYEMTSLVASAVTGLATRGGVADPTSLEGAAEPPYDLGAFRIEYAPVEPGVPVGSWRSVGVSHTIFVVESFFDELAHAAKKDPLALRRELLKKGSRELGVLNLAAEKAGYDAPAAKGIFRGCAVGKAFNSYCAQIAEVSVDERGVHVKRVVAAIDCGRVINPDIVKMQVESSIAFGLSAALRQQITFKKGRIQQGNFNDFEPVRMNEMPAVEVYIVQSEAEPTGVGEPGLPPIAPAVANAIFLATGKRLRKLPFSVSAPELVP